VFTGIVQGDGRVTALVPSDGGVRLVLAAPFAGLELGESVSVNGACLTVAELAPGGFAADLSRETLERTSLGSLVAGSRVNLERALRLADRLGGHLVSGHVDGLARVVSVEAVGQTRRVEFQCPRPLLRYIAEKGSVALDGVSLTINAVSGDGFAVMLIPHTLSVTTLDELAPGRLLNLEVDQVARYVARFLEASGDTK
jgi:riboflavin synthase